MTLPVVYFQPAAVAGLTGLQGLVAGTRLKLCADETHHVNVKRLRAGETLQLVDGLGWRATAHLVETAKGREARALVELDTAAAAEPSPPVRLTLIQALARDKRDEQAVEMACEIGAHRVVPWPAQRSENYWGEIKKRERGLHRWNEIALSAMKQSRQSWRAPVDTCLVAEKRSVTELVKEIVAANGTVFVLHEDAEAQSNAYLSGQLAELAAQLTASAAAGGVTGTEIAVLVGPEGGLAAAELQGLLKAGARLALLGPSVLRTSAAGPAALAMIQATVGTWR